MNIIDLEKSRTGKIIGRSKRGKSVYICWHGKKEPELMIIKTVENALFMGDKRYLVKEEAGDV